MRILMYHDVVEGTLPDIHSVSVTQFAAQMAWLRQEEYQVMTVEAWFQRRQEGEAIPKKSVAITFDDGFLDNYSVAWPILRQHGFTATIFLAAAYLGATSGWRDGSLAQTPLLSADQVLEMAGEGIRFGSHTMTHPRLTDLADTAAVTRELAGSKAALEDLLQQEVISFCYPYSGLNDAIKRQVAQAGYQFALTYAPAYVGGPGQDRFALQRIGVLATDDLALFQQKVESAWPLRLKWWRRQLGKFARWYYSGAAQK